jgi:uncharacterized membrane protein
MKKLLLLLLLPATSLMASEGGITGEVIIEQIGKFHPLALHFPAALTPLALIVALAARFIKGQEFWSRTIPYFMHGATITAIAAATLGLLLSANMGELEGTLAAHKHMALFFTAYMIVYSIVLLVKKYDFTKEVPTLVIIMSGIAAAILGAAAHYGGITTHGDLFIILEYL